MATVHRIGLTHEAREAALRRVRRLAKLLDNELRIPFTKFRIGLDPILGLVLGLGDLIGAALSSYIIIEAKRLGVPRSVLVRMMLNVAADAVGGSAPVVGDVFDAAWKCNMRNVRLLEEWLREQGHESVIGTAVER
ncbi:MAG: DUF4112 domain-containing protein [Phycisphaerales bacterium]|nr:DUF4112 domain-containing protein [Phycisphaerales bacterium]MCI0632150.1 DUF4112 domain-containing protein [Phycisphaerales bacterium]MCI0676047.1 DUF4112 domain-containing protein [Phycisphaerales bacterium]